MAYTYKCTACGATKEGTSGSYQGKWGRYCMSSTCPATSRCKLQRAYSKFFNEVKAIYPNHYPKYRLFENPEHRKRATQDKDMQHRREQMKEMSNIESYKDFKKQII